ncbi:MAG: PIN domain-containing protein [Thermoanaerobaculia bacterium]|nr:PIN domain-containing protein [Thermoanaerobaculia bacterium]
MRSVPASLSRPKPREGAALFRRGGRQSEPARLLLRACLERRLEPLMGEALFADYESLLARDALFEGCQLTASEREAVLNAFLSVCRWSPIYFLWRANLRDESANHLIELAVAGGARAIITKNVRDLRRGELRFPDLRILAPEELLKELSR